MVLLAAVLAVSGCVNRPAPSELPSEDWQMTGKLGIRAVTGSRVVGIDWRQQSDSSDISLSGPLGLKLASISVSAAEILVDDGQAIRRYGHADGFQVPGAEPFRLPWQSLRFWLRGLYSDGVTPLAATGIQEGDWQLQILESDEQGPRLLLAEHPRLTLRLKVRNWRFFESSAPIDPI